MPLLLIGLNHNSAEVSIRETVAFAPESVPSALQELQAMMSAEVSILSTCNRTEVVLAVPDHSSLDEHLVVAWLHRYHGLDADQLGPHLYYYREQEVVAHLMAVASGLDSLVLGEPQILGQLKSAVSVARDAGSIDSILMRLYQRVFAAAKRVRTETAIGENPVSVAYAAVDLAGRIYESLSSLQVLLVGAGDTIALVGSHLKSAGAQKITIANRSLERGHALAESLQATACLLSDLPDILPSIDIVVSSTASQLPILGKGLIETALRKRKHKPMLLIDIAVPRDVEAEVAELEDVYLYTVDDLRGIVVQNKAQREQEAERAHAILRQEVAAYERLVRADASTELIRCYREQAHELAQAELDRAKKELAAGRDPEQVIEMMTRALTNKLLHAPSRGLKSLAEDDPAQLELAKRLLDLP